MISGFDPLYQFMHEDDAARAVCAAVARRLRGVFNVAGPRPLPLSMLIREAGRGVVAVPETILPFLLGKFGLPKLPRGAINHLKYSLVVDSTAFASQAEFEYQFDEYATIRSFSAPLLGPVELD
jgi:UDP-glucose 4-epimerase